MFWAGNMEEGMKIISESDSTIQKIITETTASASRKRKRLSPDN
jgi:hypothetical protein